MSFQYRCIAVVFFVLSHAGALKIYSDPDVLGGPFGSKPIQISIGSDGITAKKGGGFECHLEAMNGKYTEWGETEKDAQGMVMRTCGNGSGILLCHRDKITCKELK